MDAKNFSGDSRSSGETKKRHLHKSEFHSQLNFLCLQKVYGNKLLCDIVLVCEGREILAHKLILALASTFFYFKFSNDRKSGLLNRIEIESISYETLSTIINYIYQYEVVITEDNVEELLAAAYMLALLDLQKACSDFLKENLTNNNCIGTGRIATQYKCLDVIPLVDDYVEKHFSEVIKHNDFYNISYEHLSGIISSDSLCTQEEDVLMCVMRWVRSNVDQRKHLFYMLMEHVRFLLIPQKNLLQSFAAEHWIESDPGYDSFLAKIFKCYGLGGQAFLSKPRQSSKVLVVTGISSESSLEVYDFKRNVWINWLETHSIKPKNGCRRIVCIESKIYVVTDTNIYVWNAVESNWLECCHFIEEPLESAIAIENNSIYFVGGSNDKYYSATVQVFHTSTGTLKKMRDTPVAKGHVGLGVFKGNMYAAGGMKKASRSSIYCNSLDCYKPDKDTWYSMPNMMIERCNSGVVGLGDTLYVIGGFSNGHACNAVEAFNLTELSWKRLPDLNIARDAPGVIAVNNQLYAIGGHNKEDLDSVEVYDFRLNTWSMLPNTMQHGKRWVIPTLTDRKNLNL